MSFHPRQRLLAATTDVVRRTIVVGIGAAGIATAFANSGWQVSKAEQEPSPARDRLPASDLNAIQVFYNHPEDPAAFQEYLYNTHVPLVRKVPGIQEVIVHTGFVGVDGSPGDIYQVGTVVWANQADREAALASAEGQIALVDVANFATGGFTAYLAHVEKLSLT